MEPWFSQMKSDRVGELPDAVNESLCEDIIASWRKMPSKVEIWEKAKVGFAPTAVSLLSKVSTVAFSLARLLQRRLRAHS